MLVVRVDLLPGGHEAGRRTLGVMNLANVSDLADVSSYLVEMAEAANPLTGATARTAVFFVAEHDRRQSVWTLVEKACTEIMKASTEGC
ncbi:MAG: hypothetical protein JWO25_1916 [Alphaproteobacteria bacterium]|nr:hypothetical protein [Alphaproteobacteria bacterium]